MEHPHIVSRTNVGLLVVDMQEKFAPAVTAFDEIVQNVVRLTLAFQMFDMPVIVTEQSPRKLGNTVDLIRKQFSLLEIVEKDHFSCTQSTHFWNQMGKIEVDSLVICGVEAHVCISQSVLELLQRGVRVHVVRDAIGSRNPRDAEVAYDKMIQAGAVPATTEMVLFELAQKAGTQSFKNIQRMVKRKLKPRDQDSGESAAQPAPPAPAAETTAKQADKEEWETHSASEETGTAPDEMPPEGLVDTPVVEEHGATEERNDREEHTHASADETPSEEDTPPAPEQATAETQGGGEDAKQTGDEDAAETATEAGEQDVPSAEDQRSAEEGEGEGESAPESEASTGSDHEQPAEKTAAEEGESSENGTDAEEPSLDDQLADILNDGVGDEDNEQDKEK